MPNYLMTLKNAKFDLIGITLIFNWLYDWCTWWRVHNNTVTRGGRAQTHAPPPGSPPSV